MRSDRLLRPGDGTCSGRLVSVRPNLDLSLLACLCLGGRFASDELSRVGQHSVQDHGELSSQRYLRLTHASRIAQLFNDEP